MPKIVKAFRGVPDGEIYPREFQVGDECPPELVQGAKAVGAIEEEAESGLTVAQLREALSAKGIEYKATAKKADLEALLARSMEGDHSGDGFADDASANASDSASASE
ncbi:HeH/LEM domain-containing protein [Cupriavidus gilardii]|uniref:HeH/LEM domain-containing protein n=1 Tax=Cupriavidus gilardii TaxID=82541 RepID=UPI0021B1B26C|nr:HeH/LEM domain-containing protein [Cupriavidus gilardii]UXC38281.1 HeH/LEM domain-containing protein [Cupriavidus gilardii]